ncbi:MAG: cell division protein FtsW [Clostridia bacterium]|nr:cell division protein FtsW [Clostridia bacterium]
MSEKDEISWTERHKRDNAPQTVEPDTAPKKRLLFASGRSRKDPIFDTPVSDLGTIKQDKPLSCGSIDMTFLLIVLGLLLFGVIMAYSASSIYSEQQRDDSLYYIKRHLMFIMLALAVTVPFILKARPWFWRFFAIASYGGAVALLLLVLLIGQSEGDAQRWIQLGPITIQPSEIAKLAVAMTMALLMTKYEKQIMSDHKFGGNFRYGVLLPGACMGLIVLLVAAERHISGVMIICMIGAAVMLLGGTKMRWILLLGGAVVVMGTLLIVFSSYADTRLDIWLRIDELDPLGEAWQTLQGLYAIGSGGLFGLGLGNSRQKFGYVSEPQNDFIFTIICEELGFFGAVAVLLLFGLLAWRGFQIASKAPDKFCALTVYGIVFKTVLQAALNIAVVTNSMPNTGISLPFFSSGGTALAIQIFEMGIVLNISRFSYVDK